MDKAKDKELYMQVKETAKTKFKRFPSAYASMWIQKEYKRLGGEYTGEKKENLNQWVKEKWIQVVPLLTEGKIIECGGNNKDTKACRPIKRVNKNTPITIQELLELHSVEKILEFAKKKNKNMKSRLNWKELRFD